MKEHTGTNCYTEVDVHVKFVWTQSVVRLDVLKENA